MEEVDEEGNSREEESIILADRHKGSLNNVRPDIGLDYLDDPDKPAQDS